MKIKKQHKKSVNGTLEDVPVGQPFFFSDDCDGADGMGTVADQPFFFSDDCDGADGMGTVADLYMRVTGQEDDDLRCVRIADGVVDTYKKTCKVILAKAKLVIKGLKK